MRCFKARVVSWLNSTRIGAIAVDIEGNPYIAAVYDNGKYVDVDPHSVVRIPDSPRDLWGPDGPLDTSQEQPEEKPEEEQGNDSTDEQ